MKRHRLASLAVLSAVTGLRALSSDTAIVAAMKLPEAANYTWTTRVDDDARSYTVDGQTDRAGDLSLVTMPMVATVRRRAGTGTANSDNLSTVLFKGDENFGVQVDSGWKTADELASTTDGSVRGGYPGGSDGVPRRGRRGAGGFPGAGSRNGRPPPAYSNLQKTLSRPHEEIGIIVATVADLKIDGEIASGTLSDTAAKLLLVHPGQKEITPLKASGTFRFWLKDGALVKYEVKLEGTLAVMNRGDRHEIEVHQTSLTEIQHVGTTKFDVPDEARKKLGG